MFPNLSRRMQERDIEELLGPLESRCFTYFPSERGLHFDGNGSSPLPFVFQWCHKGRATIRLENNRDRRVRYAMICYDMCVVW